MPTLSPQERLQPALLDRLIDEEPDKTLESREARLISARRLRAAVLRDLAWLFNSTRQTGDEIDAEQYPHSARSTLAYGLPPLAGNSASSVDGAMLEVSIRDAIIAFEPRIVPETLQVHALMSETSLDHHNQIQLEIRGSLWSVPVPIEMLLRTDLDLESGEIQVQDLGA
ncbi:MAG: type VI secretion system baseplate subunit TssE [Panacagrimonas sp.]